MTSERDKRDNAEPGLLASVKRLVRHLVATAYNRAELLALELQEEFTRFVDALLLAAAVIVFGLMTLVMFTFAVVFAVGEEHRLMAAAVAAAVYLVAAFVAFWRLRLKLKQWSAFSATRAELRKDRAWLEGRDTKP